MREADTFDVTLFALVLKMLAQRGHNAASVSRLFTRAHIAEGMKIIAPPAAVGGQGDKP